MPGCRSTTSTPPPVEERTRGDNKQERGGLLANWWMSASRFPLLGCHFSNKKLLPLLHSAKNTRETTLREVTPKVRDAYMLCWVSLFCRFSHFLSFFPFGGVLWAVRVVNKAPDNRGASSCTCEQPGAQASSSSHLVYVAVAGSASVLWNERTRCFAPFFFFPLPLLLYLSERAVTGDGVDTSWVRLVWHIRGIK